MGKRLQMAATGEYILWATIPETAKSSFNRAYGTRRGSVDPSGWKG